MKDPKLFLVSAPSGAGKSSLIDAVLASAKQSDLALELSISYTTRSPRKGESNGNQYFFISEEDFINKKNSNFFLEYADCLLYTSPSPRDATLSRMPSSA